MTDFNTWFPSSHYGQVVQNVKHYGAMGDSTNGVDGTDDRAAIQAAVDHTASQFRGIIYFPPGIYRIGSPGIDFSSITSGDSNITFQGAGPGTSQLVGSFNGYILDRDTVGAGNFMGTRIEGLRVVNLSTSGGAIRWSGTQGFSLDNCLIEGRNGLIQGDSFYNPVISNCTFRGNSNAAGIGIFGTGNVIGCDITGWGHGIRTTGQLSLSGGRIELCAVGIMLGMALDDSTYASFSSSIKNVSFESNSIAIYGNSMNSSSISEVSFFSNEFSQAGASIAVTSITRSGATATVTLPSAHGFGVGVEFGAVLKGQTDAAYAGEYIATSTGTNTFTYTVSGTPASPAAVPGTLDIPAQYGLLFHNGNANSFNNITASGWFYDSVIKCDSAQEANTFQNVFLTNDFDGASLWEFPSDPTGFKVLNSVDAPSLACTFAQLPGESGALISTAVEGMEFNITNSNTATWGATAAGGGANHVKVRYNGTNWTVVGI